jgi:hypothetical protein
MVYGVIAPFIGGDHTPVKSEDLIEFATVEGNRHIEALSSRLAQRDEYCGCLPILRTGTAIVHALPLEQTILRQPRSRVRRPIARLRLPADQQRARPKPEGNPLTFMYRMLELVMAPPWFRHVLSALAPHCPATLPSLPETVRSGTGS